ncbi:MAG TPA: organomercurial lyase [Acidiferrobacterales bacterium]|nr:organomercurial lyase [Acidiferrobacterales bacterium]
MIPSLPENRPDPKTAVLEALARLRAAFPLEARLLTAAEPVRATYAQVLTHWLRATPPLTSAFDADALAALVKLDAVVPEEHGIGCYPFSTADTGIRVTLPGGTVNAMCAIDALAVARLARARTRVDATCTICGASIAFHVEENGGLDHDQVEMARVIWQHAGTTHTSCSRGLCRRIRFLCRACPEAEELLLRLSPLGRLRVPHFRHPWRSPITGEHFTLPQAAAIGNAFFRFQSALLAAHAGPAT